MKRLAPRQRRCKLIRSKISERADRVRLSVHKTSQHIYATLFAPNGSYTIGSISSLSKVIREQDFGQGKIKRAAAIGASIAELAKSKGISQVAFDRSGYKYHGCVKALAEGAREAGLDF